MNMAIYCDITSHTRETGNSIAIPNTCTPNFEGGGVCAPVVGVNRFDNVTRWYILAGTIWIYCHSFHCQRNASIELTQKRVWHSFQNLANTPLPPESKVICLSCNPAATAIAEMPNPCSCIWYLWSDVYTECNPWAHVATRGISNRV